MTLDAYETIYAAAPAWLQNAMEMSLITLLRRGTWPPPASPITATARPVVPQKTEGSTLLRLKIVDADGALAALVTRCRADNIASPFIVHRMPERLLGQKAREAHSRVLDVDITREVRGRPRSAGIGRH